MNRIILIGNGFDLAHGLKTSYRDFIEDLWSKFSKDIAVKTGSNSKWQTIAVNDFKDEKYKYENDFFSLTVSYLNEEIDEKSLKSRIDYKNKFLQAIAEDIKIKNWVDIEELYFKKLVDCKDRFQNRLLKKDDYELYSVDKLNEDFEAIKNELKKYLKEQKTNFVNENIRKYIFNEFDEHNVTNNPFDGQILLLNFNYTKIEEKYKDGIKITDENIIHIHGTIDEKDNNPMIFGYGDEKAEESTKIENLNENEFLKNVKSIKYVECSNYEGVLEFLDKKEKDSIGNIVPIPYEIFIFGHSCGNSDRTLLNKIFEHNSCSKIRPFYYKNDYSEKTTNIYRNFDDKSKYRERIRKISECCEMPQKDSKSDFELFKEKLMIEVTVDTTVDAFNNISNEVSSKSDLKLNFYIGKFQVTQKLWNEIMRENPSIWKGENLPVECVNWYHAIAFCNKLSIKFNLEQVYSITNVDFAQIDFSDISNNDEWNNIEIDTRKNGFRLPTEAEWEYAARGGSKSGNNEYAGCNNEADLDKYAWYYKNSSNKTHVVGKLKANELDLYDMSGNVWEWCYDLYDSGGSYRVLRGGSWYNDAGSCLVSYRNSNAPGGRHDCIGFRLVLPL